MLSASAYLRVKLLTPTSILPRRSTCGSAGYDISANETIIIPPGKRALVGSGISVEIPPNTYLRIAPRSGLATRGIDVSGGVVDSDYRGEIKVILVNNSDKEFSIFLGERMAQMILEQILTPDVEVISQHCIETRRGDKGFGSTGMSSITTCGYTGLTDKVVPSDR